MVNEPLQGRLSVGILVVVTTDRGELRYVEQIVVAALLLLEAEMSRLRILSSSTSTPNRFAAGQRHPSPIQNS
jgi:hypothetical protein